MRKNIVAFVKKNAWFYYYIHRVLFLIKYEIGARVLPDSYFVKKRYRERFGFDMETHNPMRLTSKMQLLKLYDHNPIYTLYADKSRVRNFIGDKFGKDILVPLLYNTDSIDNINSDNINVFPCVLKANTGCGTYSIMMSGEKLDWPLIRAKARIWIRNNHYYKCQEWQYKNIKPHFLVEKLLLTKDGMLPNDYKLFYINGELQFVHVSVNSFDGKYKIEYDENWKPLPFSWERRITSGDYVRGAEVPTPSSFDRMKEIGSAIAANMPQVRVDFYDVDGKLYFGEITLCHGSGMNIFIPDEYDIFFGKKLHLKF